MRNAIRTAVFVYDHGPMSVTGHGEGGSTTPGELNCTSVIPEEEQCQDVYSQSYDASDLDSPWPVALSFVCMPEMMWYSPDECAHQRLQSRFVTMNRYCEAKPNAGQTFTCFDIAPETDLDEVLAQYMKVTTMNPNCTVGNVNVIYDDDDDPNTNYTGGHWYAPTCIGNSTHTNCIHGGSQSFYDINDTERLRTVMSSQLIGVAPTMAPTAGPASDAARTASQTCLTSCACLLVMGIAAML
jgi:hypothetical protein